MAKQTIKRTAVWNPPRFTFLIAGEIVANTGQKNKPTVWEGGDSLVPTVHCTEEYRMPLSGEPVGPAAQWLGPGNNCPP